MQDSFLNANIADDFEQWQCCRTEVGCFKQVPVHAIRQRFEDYLTTGEISEETLVAMQGDLQKQDIFDHNHRLEADLAMLIGDG